MRLLIHDLRSEDFQNLFPNPLDEGIVISKEEQVHAPKSCCIL